MLLLIVLMAITSLLHYTSQRLLTVILCFVLIMISACARTRGKNYFPLADGAKWEYVGHASSANGNQISFHAIIKVDGETLINNQRYFKCIITSDLSDAPEIGKGMEAVRYYRVAADGIYVRRVTGGPFSLESVRSPIAEFYSGC